MRGIVLCPIALAVHCTGCPFFKFCPAKSMLGDYGNNGAEPATKVVEQENGELNTESAPEKACDTEKSDA